MVGEAAASDRVLIVACPPVPLHPVDKEVRRKGMLAEKTSKNQLTLPKEVPDDAFMEAMGGIRSG